MGEGAEEEDLVEDLREAQEVDLPAVEDYQAEVGLVVVEEARRLVVEDLVDPLVDHPVGNMVQGETLSLTMLASSTRLRDIPFITRLWIVESHQFKVFDV